MWRAPLANVSVWHPLRRHGQHQQASTTNAHAGQLPCSTTPSSPSCLFQRIRFPWGAILIWHSRATAIYDEKCFKERSHMEPASYSPRRSEKPCCCFFGLNNQSRVAKSYSNLNPYLRLYASLAQTRARLKKFITWYWRKLGLVLHAAGTCPSHHHKPP